MNAETRYRHMMRPGPRHIAHWLSALLATGMVWAGNALSAERSAQEKTAVSIYIDNDILTSTGNDHDYTAGFAVAFSGPETSEHALSMHHALGFINHHTGIARLLQNNDKTFFTREAGLLAFTPRNLEEDSPIYNDRPYASLIYLANTRQDLQLQQRHAWISTLSLGLLGVPVISGLQNSIHQGVGTDISRGWKNQISRGGEPTFKYSLARHSYHDTGNDNIQFTTASGLGVGYITEAFYGASFRTGALRTPWWSFNVYTSNYGERSDVVMPPSPRLDELYFVAGANIKVRLYNVFLQGQFRDSEVSYAAEDLDKLILEGWAGVAWEVSTGMRLGYIVRMQSSEVKTGLSQGRFTYGELSVIYTFME